MSAKTLVTVVLAGGLAFGIGMPAHAAETAQPTCTTQRVLVSPAVEAKPAVYGEAPLITPAKAAWTERILVSPAVEEVSHIVHHEARYAERLVIDQPYAPAVPGVDEVSHIVRHEAVTKTVHHDAVTKVVHHDAVTKVVHHPAVTKTVHHDAVTHTEYKRYSWVGGGDGPQAGDTPLTQPSHWNSDNKKYDGSETGVVLHKGKGNGSYFFWAATEVTDKAAWDETVIVKKAWDEKVVVTPARDETVVVTEAWDEIVVVTEAWDEKVIDTPAQPGTPEQPEISHIEYDLLSDAYDEKVIDVAAQDAVYADIEHPAEAAVYGAPELVSPETPGQEAVYKDEEICTIISADGPTEPGQSTPQPTAVLAEGTGAGTATLAETGGSVAPLVPLGAGALVVGGAAALLLRRRTRRSAQD